MKLNIAYSCNENYLPQTGISIFSLLENNKEAEEINFYYIEKDVSESSIKLLQELIFSYNRKLYVIPFDHLCEKLKINSLGRHIETVYTKLFFDNIPELDKIIYLDSDIIINGSLKEMWNIDLQNNYFGLVKTVTKDYSKVLGLKETDEFYNDGVAIVNVKLLRKDNMQEKFLNFINLYNGNPPVLSEGTINVVCKDRIKTIHPKFNFGSSFFMYDSKGLNLISNEEDYYPNYIIEEARSNPIVIHYLAGWFKRPWEIGCTHPLKDKYLQYKAKTIWKDYKLSYKKLPLKLKFLRFTSSLLPIKFFVYLMRFNKVVIKKYDKKNN